MSVIWFGRLEAGGATPMIRTVEPCTSSPAQARHYVKIPTLVFTSVQPNQPAYTWPLA